MRRSWTCLALIVALASGHRGEPQTVSSSPNAVNKPTLTHMTGRGVAVLFGGYPQRGSPLGETWLLEQGCWRQLTISGPPPRGAHGAAYDARRRRLVVFGGSGADRNALGDTWEFDGERWEQRSASGPSPRSMLRMTFDERRQRVLMFGGTGSITGPHSGDVWEWDGTVWTRVAENGPPPRFESALAYDANRDVTVLFGGNQTTDRKFVEGALDDTWLLRGNVWSEVRGAGPSKRDHHAMAFHAGRGLTVMFGGSSGAMLGDTWIFDGQRWAERTESNGPSARGGVPAMTYDTDRRKVLMYGGWGSAGPQTDLWEWDGTWVRLSPSSCPRSG